MAMSPSSPGSGAHGDTPRWNLFAQALEDLLRAHDNTPLSRLDNLRERPGDELDPDDSLSPRELVHREKVRRLVESLNEPGTFPILSRDDLERVTRYFRLDDGERRRLRVAMLATHIQRLLYERYGEKHDQEERVRAASIALRGAEALLPSLDETLRDEAVDADEESVYREAHGALLTEGAMAMTADPSPLDPRRLDQALAGALDAIDRGTLALSLSASAPSSAERLERARAARDAFSDALERLDEQEASVRASEVWRLWHDEARRGYDEADERVIDLGG
jgi:hypothetical protein